MCGRTIVAVCSPASALLPIPASPQDSAHRSGHKDIAGVWRQIAPGVWRGLAGKPDRPTLTDAAQSKPRADRLATLPQSPPPFALDHIELRVTRDFAIVR